jgi:hypothetical protein
LTGAAGTPLPTVHHPLPVTTVDDVAHDRRGAAERC